LLTACIEIIGWLVDAGSLPADADSAVSMRSDTTQVVPSPPGLLGNPADLAEFGMSRPARTIVT
jgi:hypothetical protein